MRGQTPSDAQRRTVERLRSKGWRGNYGDMFALAVPMYFDRPYVGLPRERIPKIFPFRPVRFGFVVR